MLAERVDRIRKVIWITGFSMRPSGLHCKTLHRAAWQPGQITARSRCGVSGHAKSRICASGLESRQERLGRPANTFIVIDNSDHHMLASHAASVIL
jgi:hypothetical protein